MYAWLPDTVRDAASTMPDVVCPSPQLTDSCVRVGNAWVCKGCRNRHLMPFEDPAAPWRITGKRGDHGIGVTDGDGCFVRVERAAGSADAQDDDALTWSIQACGRKDRVLAGCFKNTVAIKIPGIEKARRPKAELPGPQR